MLQEHYTYLSSLLIPYTGTARRRMDDIDADKLGKRSKQVSAHHPGAKGCGLKHTDWIGRIPQTKLFYITLSLATDYYSKVLGSYLDSEGKILSWSIWKHLVALARVKLSRITGIPPKFL